MIISKKQLMQKQCPFHALATTTYEAHHGIKAAQEEGMKVECVGPRCAMYRERVDHDSELTYAFCGLAGNPKG